MTIFYCDTLTMWHFSTVTFRLCDNFLLWHSVTQWMDCPSTPKSGRFVTVWHSDPLKFWPTHGCDILSTSDFDFSRQYLVQVAADFNRWRSHDTIPLTFGPPHTDSGGWDLAGGMLRECFFDYFPIRLLVWKLRWLLAVFPVVILTIVTCCLPPRETIRKASRWSPVTCDKTSTFRFRAKVDILSQSR